MRGATALSSSHASANGPAGKSNGRAAVLPARPDFQTGKPSERRRRELARINRIPVAVIEACERFLNRPEIRNATIAGLQSGLAGLYPEPRHVP